MGRQIFRDAYIQAIDEDVYCDMLLPVEVASSDN